MHTVLFYIQISHLKLVGFSQFLLEAIYPNLQVYIICINSLYRHLDTVPLRLIYLAFLLRLLITMFGMSKITFSVSLGIYLFSGVRLSK